MFQRELDLLSQTFDQRDRRIGTTFYCNALLTKGDGTGALLVTNGKPREIWVRRSDNRELFTCYLPSNPSIVLEDGHAEYETLEVRVGYVAGIDQLQVLDQLSLAGKRGIGTTSPMEALIYRALYAALGNLSTLRARPTTPVSTDIAVDGPYWYSRPSTGLLTYFASGTVGGAIATAIAALAAGKHQLAVIYLNKETNTLGILTSAAATAAGSLPSRSEFGTSDVAAIRLGPSQEPIIPIYLYYGQTSVIETDFFRSWDLRPLFNKAVARPAEKLYLYATYGGV